MSKNTKNIMQMDKKTNIALFFFAIFNLTTGSAGGGISATPITKSTHNVIHTREHKII
jgi:hypothetical protein